MGKLRTGITSKETYTGSVPIYCLRQMFCTESPCAEDIFPVVPVLAKEAVEGAGLIKDCKILKAILWSFPVSISGITRPYTPWADPISHTISW